MAENENTATNETVETNETEVVETPDVKPDVKDEEIEKLKKLLSKANSEAASYKKQMRDKMSEEERKAVEAAEKQAELENKVAMYERQATISSYKSNLLASGFDAETAEKSAQALAEGKMDEFFSHLNSVYGNIEKSAVAKAMANQTQPTVGAPPSTVDLQKSQVASIRQAMGLK